MDAKLVMIYVEAKALHERVFKTLKTYEPVLKSGSKTMEYLADVAYACREADKLLNQMGKDVRKMQRVAETMACMEHMRDLDNEERIQTPYCSATPSQKDGLQLPPKETDEERELLRALGVPENQLSHVRPSYKGVQEFIDRCDAEGLGLPEPIAKVRASFKDYTLSIRAKKDITE